MELVVGRCSADRRRGHGHRSEETGQGDAVEVHGGQDQAGAAPAVGAQQQRRQRREDEHADARAADGHAGGHGALALEVEADGGDARRVDQAQAQAGQQADGDDEPLDRGGQRRHGQRHRAEQTAQNHHRTEAEPVGQRRADRRCRVYVQKDTFRDCPIPVTHWLEGPPTMTTPSVRISST